MCHLTQSVPSVFLVSRVLVGLPLLSSVLLGATVLGAQIHQIFAVQADTVLLDQVQTVLVQLVRFAVAQAQFRSVLLEHTVLSAPRHHYLVVWVSSVR